MSNHSNNLSMTSDNLIHTLFGWLCLGFSLSLNYIVSLVPNIQLAIPAIVDFATIDFLLNQLTHIVQIMGVIGGLYFTFKGQKSRQK